MTFRFGALSMSRLDTCDQRLRDLMREALETSPMDFSILEGHRGRVAQDAAYARGASRLKWPNGQHNKLPSRAVDIAPYPLNWKDEKAFRALAAHVLETAKRMGIKIRWGGDFNRNGIVGDDGLIDMPHFELDEK